MSAMPTAPASQAIPPAHGAPPSPETQTAFGEPAGETIFTNVPSYEPPLPADVDHSGRVAYVLLVVILVAAVIGTVLVLIGMT